MRMPAVYDDDIINVDGNSQSDGVPPRRIACSIVFPPVGFFPFSETGTGDFYGFYWPIGREERAPLVAFSSHDAYALIPEHGDLSAAGRCQLARDEKRELTYEFASAFDFANVPQPMIDTIDTVGIDDHKQLLALDPDSPFRNCAVADQMIADNNLDGAESHYRRAIEMLPEYGAAHFGLGYLFRRTRRQSQAVIHFRQALISPLAFRGSYFWADHTLPGEFRFDWPRKALLWLQQLKKTADSLRDDPFMQNVHELKHETGVAENRDIELLIAMVDEYHRQGQFLDAVYIWVSVGDRAALETTSFRERYGFTPRTFGTRLADLLRDAGMARRAQLVESILAMFDNPDRLYL